MYKQMVYKQIICSHSTASQTFHNTCIHGPFTSLSIPHSRQPSEQPYQSRPPLYHKQRQQCLTPLPRLPNPSLAFSKVKPPPAPETDPSLNNGRIYCLGTILRVHLMEGFGHGDSSGSIVFLGVVSRSVLFKILGDFIDGRISNVGYEA
jgi:hypothetical protein